MSVPYPPPSRAGSPGLEPGDRFELPEFDPGGRLALPRVLGADGFAIDRLDDPAGRPLEAEFDPSHRALIVSDLDRLVADPRAALWLEYREPGRFRLVVEPGPAVAASGEIVTEQGVKVAFDPRDWPVLHGVTRRAGLREFDLALEAAHLATHGGFDRLIALPMVRDIEILEHQVRTAKTVLRRFRGRALLCDEVGLGKTIEAGLVLSELKVRGLIRSILVLVPPSLIEQWQGEMRRKFSLELISHDDPAFRERGQAAWGEFDGVIASIHTAKREPHRAAILGRTWDLVIVDEAHHLRNRTTLAWKFASELRKQFILLLTATPVQNNLEELFNLVTLLEPGLLSTARRFQTRFVDRRDKLTPRNVDELHALLAEVMVRNRRSTVGLQFTRRWARTERIPPSPAEQALYRDATEFVRGQLHSAKETGALSRMALLTLQMALGSSSPAAAGTLRKIAEHPKLAAAERRRLVDLADRASTRNESTKADRLLGLVDEFRDKMVISPSSWPRRRCSGAGWRRPVTTSRSSTVGCRDWRRRRPFGASAARPGCSCVPRPAARAATSSSRTPCATSTRPGTR